MPVRGIPSRAVKTREELPAYEVVPLGVWSGALGTRTIQPKHPAHVRAVVLVTCGTASAVSASYGGTAFPADSIEYTPNGRYFRYNLIDDIQGRSNDDLVISTGGYWGGWLIFIYAKSAVSYVTGYQGVWYGPDVDDHWGNAFNGVAGQKSHKLLCIGVSGDIYGDYGGGEAFDQDHCQGLTYQGCAPVKGFLNQNGGGYLGTRHQYTENARIGGSMQMVRGKSTDPRGHCHALFEWVS